MATARIGGIEWRVSPQGISQRRAGGSWRIVPRAELLALDGDGEVWAWLREQGKTRPSPSGPTTPEADRKTEQVKLRLLPRVTRALDALAVRRGLTRSECVAALVDEAGRAER
jgi:hypothetical protein